MKRRRLLMTGVPLATSFLIAGCAVLPKENGENVIKNDFWSGRLGLTLSTDPPQSFHASFELSGTAREGRLTLFTPLGSVLSELRWTGSGATLTSGDATRHFDSLQALASEVTGTPIPIAALFAWLQGRGDTAAGWQADLSRLAEGRLSATRTTPPPGAELRLILDR